MLFRLLLYKTNGMSKTLKQMMILSDTSTGEISSGLMSLLLK